LLKLAIYSGENQLYDYTKNLTAAEVRFYAATFIEAKQNSAPSWGIMKGLI